TPAASPLAGGGWRRRRSDRRDAAPLHADFVSERQWDVHGANRSPRIGAAHAPPENPPSHLLQLPGSGAIAAASAAAAVARGAAIAYRVLETGHRAGGAAALGPRCLRQL